MTLLEIAEAFPIEGRALSCEKLGNGHINRTYLVVTSEARKYVLQGINTNVFRNVDLLMNNIFAVTGYLTGIGASTLRFLNTREGGKYYSCDLMYDKLEKFIVDNAGGPFFAMWTTTVPHSAVQAPKDEVLYYVNKLGDEEPRVDGGMYLPCRYPHASYAAMVTHIDTQVGKLVAKLKELGIWDNTIFIVTSDNGPAHNGNSPMEYFQSGGPFCCAAGWGKSSLHEGGIRMPFVVAWGDRLKGTKSSHIGIFADLMPTFAELAGTEAPENDGISFAPLLYGKPAKQQEHPYLYWEFPGAKGWVAVRIGEWKGLLQKVAKGNNKMELYNLSTDPRETTDVSAEHPEIVKQMWDIVRNSHEAPVYDIEKFKLDINFPEKAE